MKRILGTRAAPVLFLCLAVFSIPTAAATIPDKNEAFFRMVRDGNITGVREAIANDQDVNVQDKSGYAPLHIGVLMPAGKVNPENKLAVVRMLLDAGADVNARSKGGRSPLMQAGMLAAYTPDDAAERLVNMLLKAGADVHIKDSEGMSALLQWSHTGKPGVVRMLLEAGADTNDKMNGGMTALMWAVLAPNNTRTIEMLIEAGADVNAIMDNGDTALRISVAYGKFEDVSILLKAGAKLENSPGPSLLHIAAGLVVLDTQWAGSFEERAARATNVITTIGQPEFKPDFTGVTKLLVEAGADINAKSGSLKNYITNSEEDLKRFEGKTPLEFALFLGNTETARYLENLTE